MPGYPILLDHVGGLVGLGALAFGIVSGISHGIGERDRFDARSWHRPRPQPTADRSFGRSSHVPLPGMDKSFVTEAAAAVRGYSPTLGLSLAPDGDRLRLLDPTAGNCALSVIEEREARLAAEAENRQLRQQLQRVNREHGQLRE